MTATTVDPKNIRYSARPESSRRVETRVNAACDRVPLNAIRGVHSAFAPRSTRWTMAR